MVTWRPAVSLVEIVPPQPEEMDILTTKGEGRENTTAAVVTAMIANVKAEKEKGVITDITSVVVTMIDISIDRRDVIEMTRGTTCQRMGEMRLTSRPMLLGKEMIVAKYFTYIRLRYSRGNLIIC